MEDLFAGKGMDMAQMKAHMAQLMADEGLPYGNRTMTYNSRLAQELGKWAEAQPKGEGIHKALFEAYFVEGQNIGEAPVLLDVVDRLGLDTEEASRVIEDRTHKQAVDEDWAMAREAKVTGVPTFVVGKYGVVGAQTYDSLEMLVVKAKG